MRVAHVDRECLQSALGYNSQMISGKLCLLYVFALLTAGSILAADPTCKSLADANAKIYTIPTHIYMTETAGSAGGTVRTRELIYLNNKTYVQVRGKWRASPVTQKDMEDIRKKSEADSLNKMTCRAVRDEAVNGEPAVLYRTHQQDEDQTTIDSQIWISKSRGVPLKLEMDMNVGGIAGKSHRTMRYEYTNVRPPAGIQ